MNPQDDHTRSFSDQALRTALAIPLDMLRYDKRVALARLIVKQLGWSRKGRLVLRRTAEARTAGPAAVVASEVPPLAKADALRATATV